MSIPHNRQVRCRPADLLINLVQWASPPGNEATHVEVVYAVTCPGGPLCRFAKACRAIRMNCSNCGLHQVVSGTECRDCGSMCKFQCTKSSRHTIVMSSRKHRGEWTHESISGVDVQLNRIIVREKENHWDSYLAMRRTAASDDFIVELCRNITQLAFDEPGIDRYNYASVILNLCQLATNPTSYLGRGNPLCKITQCWLWCCCCCITNTSNPFFPDMETALTMPVPELARECFTCATLTHVILLRLRCIEPGEGDVAFGNVHPGQLVKLARDRQWPPGLLSELISLA